MISLILPYWDRQESANHALRLLNKHYADMDMEIVVVDDGNAIPFLVPEGLRLNIRTITLPHKEIPKSPVTPWNEGVRQAKGDIIVLSCIEIIHETPILQELVASVKEPNDYVLAAAWCPEMQQWHCHSTVQLPRNPRGTGLSFCAAMHKALYWKAGGFDEEYRDGAGYEDCDFINRLLQVGAKFNMRDDLKVIHPKGGATIKWPLGAFQRNEAIFYRNWPRTTDELIFTCVKAGTVFGPEYVNILRDMVQRNLPPGKIARFVCLTDDVTGLDANVETMPLPEDLEKWWGKLYLFKRGLFPDGSRMVYFDLDTVILGPIEKVLSYDGQFATLNDFYHPERVGPAVMLWKAGDYASSIWDEWVTQGKPRHPMGDLWWIGQLDQGRFAKRADKLQALYPGMFASYKADCFNGPPKSARIVCFHGRPRPHEVTDDWVQIVWKMGGGGLPELQEVANMNMEATYKNVRAACKLPLPWLQMLPEHDQQAVLVGGGPSLQDTLRQVVYRQSIGQTIVAMNGSASYLVEHGIDIDWQIIVDARPENAKFVQPPRAKRYFIASQCAPEVFEALEGQDVTIFHMNTQGIKDVLPDGKPIHLISSGTTVGLAAMVIAYTQGYRAIHLHGYDSSYDTQHHAYPQPQNDGDVMLDSVVRGRKFKSAAWMVKQVQQFQEVAPQLAEAGVTITVAGDGLLPYVARLMSETPEMEAA